MTTFPAARTITCIFALACICVFASACGESPDPNKGQKHGGGDPHQMGEKPIGQVEIQGRTITVLSSKELTPGAVLKHCHLTVAGDAVDEMHIWVGDAKGETATKALVKGLGKHPVVDLELPADLKDAVLGVQIKVGDQTYSATGALQVKSAGDSE